MPSVLTSAPICWGWATPPRRRVVLNTASVQLLPSTVAALRGGLGSAAPLDILPAVWLSSALSVTAGLACARVLGRVWRT